MTIGAPPSEMTVRRSEASTALRLVLARLADQYPSLIMSADQCRVLIAPTLVELETLYQRLNERGQVRQSIPRLSKPPPNTGRRLSGAPRLFDASARVSSFLNAHGSHLLDFPPDVSIETKSLPPLCPSRLASLLIEVSKWSTVHPLAIDVKHLEDMIAARALTPSRHRGVAHHDPRYRYVELIADVLTISAERLRALSSGELDAARPARLTDLIAEVPRRPVPAVDEARHRNFGLGLWLHSTNALGKATLVPIKARLQGSFGEALTGVSHAVTHRLSNAILTWNPSPREHSLSGSWKRRTTLILPRAWLASASTRPDAPFFAELMAALNQLDQARISASPENRDRTFVFLRICWADSNQSYADDQAILKELNHIIELRAAATEVLTRPRGVNGWRDFRQARDKSRTMDAHDWYRRPW